MLRVGGTWNLWSARTASLDIQHNPKKLLKARMVLGYTSLGDDIVWTIGSSNNFKFLAIKDSA